LKIDRDDTEEPANKWERNIEHGEDDIVISGESNKASNKASTGNEATQIMGQSQSSNSN
jgi:hypothetical protein